MRKCALSFFLFAALLLAGLASGPTQAAPPTCENGIVVADPDANRGLVIDCANLLAAKTQFSARTPLNWGGDTPIAEWDGVSLGGDPPRVWKLHLRSRGLTGRVAPHFANVRELRELGLHHNRLTGPIPPELGSLRHLEILWLDANQLSGSIPPALGSLRSLRALWLHDNQLTGRIPAELGSCPPSSACGCTTTNSRARSRRRWDRSPA